MGNNVIYIKGIPTPKYRAQQIKQDLDLDLFPNMLANHPEHIKRSKAKRDRIMAERKEKSEERARRAKENENMLMFLGGMTVSLLLAVITLVALW